MNQERGLYDEVYSSEVVMARVGHLTRSMRQDIEQIARVLREDFPVGGMLRPVPKIAKIFLLGPYARRCWRMDEERDAVPAYEFWIIVSDRLLTRKRMWQATEARIREIVGKRCTVTLSFSTIDGVRAGKRAEDEFVIDRLTNAITLFDAKRDDPRERRGRGRSEWSAAHARLRDADTAFQPAMQALRDAERRHSLERDRVSGGQGADPNYLDDARADEERLGDALHEALMALLHTPAPDLAAVIRKLELIRDNGDGDDHAIVSLLSDVRRTAARIADCGKWQ